VKPQKLFSVIFAVVLLAGASGVILVSGYRGPEVFGVAIGAVVGLAALAVDVAMRGRKGR